MTINPDGRQSEGDVLRTRATHAPHRARLRGLGLSVGIAIALSGCGTGYQPNAWKRDEVKPSTYADIAVGARRDPVERSMVRSFMADGKIDYGELEQINDYDARKADGAVPLAALKGELASGVPQ